MKRILLLITIFFLSTDMVYALGNCKNAGDTNCVSTYKYAETQKIIKELMRDYYIRADSIQYHNSRRAFFSPEEATTQDTQYTVCSGFVYNSYYEAFNMPIQKITENHIEDAYNYYKKMKKNSELDNGNFLIYYENTVKGKEEKYVYGGSFKFSDVAKILQPGDIIVFSGHTMVVYDKIKNADGYDDVLILNTGSSAEIQSRLYSTRSLSYSYYENLTKSNIIDTNPTGLIQHKLLSSFGSHYVNSTISTKDSNGKEATLNCIKKQLIYYNTTDKRNKGPRCDEDNKTLGYKNDVHAECLGDDVVLYKGTKKIGSCQELRVNNYKKNLDLSCQNDECAIIRPFYNSNGKTVFNYSISPTQYSKSSLRTKYPGLIIEKTVNRGDENSVYPKDKLKYTIKITNKSNTTYDGKNYGNFVIEETINSNLVNYVSCDNNCNKSGNKITWKISSLAKDKTMTLNYTVEVKNNSGEYIESTGKFCDGTSCMDSNGKDKVYITTGLVKNKIIPLVEEIKKSYKDCYNENKGKYNGLKLVDQIYKCAWNKDFELDNFRFSQLFERQAAEKDHINFKKNITTKRILNYKAMILNNYWGGATAYKNGEKYYIVPLKWIGETAKIRNDNFNEIDFKNGDVLIYYIDYDNLPNPYTNSVLVTPESDRHTKENGYYAYIYIDGKFVGVNGSGSTKRNEFTYNYYKDTYGDSGYSKHLIDEYKDIPSKQVDRILKIANYTTLLDKDYYIILRPELLLPEKITTSTTETVPGTSETVPNTSPIVTPIAPSDIEIKGIVLDETKISLVKGESKNILYTITPEDATNQEFTWESSDEKVVKVDSNGKITAIGMGLASVSVKTKNGNITAVCRVIVNGNSISDSSGFNILYIIIPLILAIGVGIIYFVTRKKRINNKITGK